MINSIKTKTILLCTVAVCLSGCSAVSSGPRYTPRADVPNQNYTEAERTEDRADKKTYRRYEQREPCQKYRKLPRNQEDNCVVPEEADLASVGISTTTTETLLPIIHSYTVLFDFDRSDVRANEAATLDKLMREIGQYNPRQITVTGYTDSSGSAEYNQVLSQEREQAVSKALLARGIQNQTINRQARGEFNQAVETENDTRNQENRRVVIDLRR